MQALRPRVQRQVDHGLQSLSEEFGSSVEPESIRLAGRNRVRAYLKDARFDDFIPVLVYRSVREQITTLLGEQPLRVTGL